LLGVICEGKVDGMPVAVVDAVDSTVVEVGAIRMVEGSHASDRVVEPKSGTLVTPLVSVPLVDDELERPVVVGAGGSDVEGGTVLLPVGNEVLLLENVVEVMVGGFEEMVELPLGSGPDVVVLMGGSGVPEVLVDSTPEVVEFVMGGCPGSVVLVLSGGVVTVSVDDGSVVEGVSVEGIPVVEMIPVPGPVIALDGIMVRVTFGDGSRMLEMAELISLKRELMGLLGSVVLDDVTMPVGAMRISDELVVVGVGSSSDVDVLGGSELAGWSVAEDCSEVAGGSEVDTCSEVGA
jgi:hypothetical protein